MAGNDLATRGRQQRMASARRSGLDILAIFALFQAGCIGFGLAFPNDFAYLSEANFRVLLQAVPELGIVAIGVGILMIAGEFDLSVGATYTFCAIIMADLATNAGVTPWGAAALAVGLGACIGLLNAALTFGLGIPSFIATLGAALFWQGFTLLYHGASFLPFKPGGAFRTTFAGQLGFVQAAFLWFLLVATAAGVLLHRHRLGNRIFPVGANVQAARSVGVPTIWTKTLCFALTGALAAFAGVLATTRVSSIVPGQGGDLALMAIAACVIGGLALTGGRGTILGVALGAAMIYTIQDVLLLLRAPGFYLQLFVGLLIIVAAGLNRLARGRT
jgi:ribose/xylose/arabinose/galactoside ABC-type transport system permease subunit